MKTDYLIVGSGLTGAVIARILRDAGQDVLVVDRRSHVGGNVHDHTHPSGIRIHTYGPHYFRTTSEEIWAFVNRFATFDPYEAALKSLVDGREENWPIAGSYIRRAVGENWQPEFHGTPENFEEASLSLMPRVIYEKFVKGYSEKQWGVEARTLSAGLAKRFDVREDDEPRLMRHKYQGIPSEGYAAFTRNLLAGIPVVLNFDYLHNRNVFEARKRLIFTGPVDEFFEFRLGRLKYRGQQRESTYLPDVDYAQGAGQINNPDPGTGAHIRTLEWKQMMPKPFADRIRGTVLTQETPFTPTDPELYEYPFPDDENATLYKRYRELADATAGLLVCGRLGEYRYYDMDQAIGRAMLLGRRLLEQ
ncbi:MAG TPA: UDP-galactopyranose mutase [Thermoanaerobaculia bacterium]